MVRDLSEKFGFAQNGAGTIEVRAVSLAPLTITARPSGRVVPMGHGRSVGVVTVLAALMGLSVLAGCGNSRGAGDSAKSTTSTRRDAATTSTAPASTTLDPTPAAVLQAYRAGWTAYDRALATANAYDSGLPATMVDPLLQKVRANLLADHNSGIVGRGSVVLHPKVASLSGSTATVVDCTFSSSELVYAATGKAVPPLTPPQHDGVQATLVLTGGVWKVSQQSVSEGKCPPGS
jgi:hypothetical protein